MNDSILQKYKADRLTADELQRLRDELGAATDEQLYAMLEADWNASGSPTDSDREHADSLYAGVARRAFDDDTPHADDTMHPAAATIWRRLFGIAQKVAVVLLPVAIVALSLLYRENRALAADTIVVSTAGGEQASVTLPDGSRVAINQNSKLTYVPSRFRGSERRVDMDGEGFYCVARDESRPFFVDADGLAVRVLGTKFNLKARDSEPTAELVLAEGSVAFTALKTAQSETLHPGQKIVLDKRTGHMDVETLDTTDDEVAWRRKELVFRNTPLSLVFAQLRKQFHTDIVIGKGVDQHSLFTGTLSAVNLNDNLEIIDLSCEVKSKIIGKTVYVENK